MNAEITRPQKCPHREEGKRKSLCLFPEYGTPLYCDTAASAVGQDGFPKDCPLRRDE